MAACEEQFGAALGHIYDAALDRRQWPGALTAIADLTGAIGANLISNDKRRPEATFFPMGRLSHELRTVFLARHHLSLDNPWTQAILPLAAGEIVRSTEIVPIAALIRTEYYADILRPQGIVHHICAVITNDERRSLRLGVFRSAAAGPGGADEIGWLARLAPHVRRAARVAERIESSDLAKASLLGALDTVQHGVFALGEQGQVLMANRMGEAILALDDGLTCRAAKLGARLPREAARLDRLVAGAVAGAGGSTRVSRSQGKIPYIALIVPARQVPLWPLGDPPAALVIVTDLQRDRSGGMAAFAELFGLTPAEARVAREVGAGRGLPETTRHLGISLGTARTHLQQVFRKTGLNSQSALVALAAGMAGTRPFDDAA
jgi:DNA-binding CsgD family transcriptional regulator/PAS domain-containing protein